MKIPPVFVFCSLLMVPLQQGMGQNFSAQITEAESQLNSQFTKGDTFEKMLLGLVRDGDVIKEIEATDEQLELIAALTPKLAQWEAEEKKRLENLHGKTFERDMGFSSKFRPELTKAVQARWSREIKESILLPFQVNRLERRSISMVRAKIGDEEFFSLPWVRQQLDIDDEQLKQIKERIRKEKKELKKEMEEITEEVELLEGKAVKKILGELTEEQNEKIEKWFPEFAEKPEDK